MPGLQHQKTKNNTNFTSVSMILQKLQKVSVGSLNKESLIVSETFFKNVMKTFQFKNLLLHENDEDEMIKK